MVIKEGVNIQGLDIVMRQALIAAEAIWKENGRSEGVTVTCGMDGTHSAGSFHYYGRALDFRTRYFDELTKIKVFGRLKESLSSFEYTVVLEKTHIHVQYDRKGA